MICITNAGYRKHSKLAKFTPFFYTQTSYSSYSMSIFLCCIHNRHHWAQAMCRFHCEHFRKKWLCYDRSQVYKITLLICPSMLFSHCGLYCCQQSSVFVCAHGIDVLLIVRYKLPYTAYLIDGLVQDCSNSSALAMELLQSCTKPSL